MKLVIKINYYENGWEIYNPGKAYVYLNTVTNSEVSWDVLEGKNKTNFWKRYKKRFA